MSYSFHKKVSFRILLLALAFFDIMMLFAQNDSLGNAKPIRLQEALLLGAQNNRQLKMVSLDGTSRYVNAPR